MKLTYSIGSDDPHITARHEGATYLIRPFGQVFVLVWRGRLLDVGESPTDLIDRIAQGNCRWPDGETAEAPEVS